MENYAHNLGLAPSNGGKWREYIQFHLGTCFRNFPKYAGDFSRVDDKSQSISKECEGSVD
jgi:hypothetical protein